MPLYDKRDGRVCGNCVYFTRHYIRSYRYLPLEWGHCRYPRLKDRGDWQTCPHFKMKG